jgi:hypothetical protein
MVGWYRETEWFVNWIGDSEKCPPETTDQPTAPLQVPGKKPLNLPRRYYPKTYEQCASVLQGAGYDKMAGDIRLAAEQRRFEETPLLSWLKAGLFLEKWATGFGYRIRFAFGWALLLVAVGSVVFLCTGQAELEAHQKIPNGVYAIEYSLDLLLPLVKLRDAHYTKIGSEPRKPPHFTG